MERCTESLKDHIFKHRESVPGISGKTADLRVCRWAKEITAGLHFMHEVGIIHRDLKLENILVRTYSDLDILTAFASPCKSIELIIQVSHCLQIRQLYFLLFFIIVLISIVGIQTAKISAHISKPIESQLKIFALGWHWTRYPHNTTSMYSRYRDPHRKSAENDHSLLLLLSLKRRLKQTRMIAIW